MFCQKCGRDLGEDFAGEFCTECGSPLQKAVKKKAVSGNSKKKYLFFAVPAAAGLALAFAFTGKSGGEEVRSGRFSYDRELTSIVIPEGVTKIDSYAFYECENLSSVTIPEGVKEIGDSAFYGCSNLSSVTIPEGVDEIGDLAFYGCENLSSVTIPEGVEVIGDSAFYGCENLSSVTIPDSVKSIGDGAFSGCPAEERVMRNREYMEGGTCWY